MIVVKKADNSFEYPVYGNNAYKYKRYDPEEKKQRKINKNSAGQLKRKLKSLFVVILLFAAGMLIVGRYAMILSLNNECNELKSELDSKQKINEELSIELMEHSDITQIEKYATSKLNMIRPDGSNIVHIQIADAGKNVKDNKTSNSTKRVSFLERFISMFN